MGHWQTNLQITFTAVAKKHDSIHFPWQEFKELNNKKMFTHDGLFSVILSSGQYVYYLATSNSSILMDYLIYSESGEYL